MKNFTVRLDFFHTYTYVEHLGQGNFAEVHKVQNTLNGEFYAAKIFTKSSMTSKTKVYFFDNYHDNRLGKYQERDCNFENAPRIRQFFAIL